MSELSSLFLKVKITKEQLENFLISSPKTPELNDNWMVWWNSRDMHSKTSLGPESLIAYNYADNKGILEGWLQFKEACAFSDYDQTTEEWRIGIIFFSENFSEMLPMFAFITSIENYITESKDNLAIVYPFFWGDSNVSAYLNFEGGKALFNSKIQTTTDVDPEILNSVTEYLTKKLDELLDNTEIH